MTEHSIPAPPAAAKRSLSWARVARWWEASENPVLGKELRSRMRGPRSYAITGCYTLVVMAFVLFIYYMLAANADQAQSLNRQAATVGRGIWTWGCLVQAVLLPLVVPAFTCGAITLERERDLLDLLLLTRQTPAQIALGKLGAGVGLGLILVLSSVPVLSLSMVLGGVSPGEIMACLTLLVTAVIAAGALGLVASTLAPRTVSSTVAVYGLVGTGIIGVPALLAFVGAAQSLVQTGSEWGIFVMLFALMAAAFPPGVGLGLAVGATLKGLGRGPTDRSGWWVLVGAGWCGLLLFLYLPGVSDLLLQGGAVLVLHPAVAITTLMIPEAHVLNGSAPFLWAICSLVYLGAAVWFFYISILRIRVLRAH
jgi:ABC-type transport system involved in multi-copper enzyme maturation permease subunit